MGHPQASGELTPSMKLKRRVVEERYREQVEALYAQEKAEAVPFHLMRCIVRMPWGGIVAGARWGSFDSPAAAGSLRMTVVNVVRKTGLPRFARDDKHWARGLITISAWTPS